MKQPSPGGGKEPAKANEAMIRRIEKRIEEYCNRPASNALADLVFLEVTIAKDAAPGGASCASSRRRASRTPSAFHVGQFPETTRKPMLTAPYQVLGKEELSLRQRPEEEVEVKVEAPCTMNGQIASGEINATALPPQGTAARRLRPRARSHPFLADAVPGWFQPVLALYDAPAGDRLPDDFRFKPDPVILFEVPADGEYVVRHQRRDPPAGKIHLPITLGEIPYLTGIFPLGGKAARPLPSPVASKGWNLQGAESSHRHPAPGRPLLDPAKAGGRLSNPPPLRARYPSRNQRNRAFRS